MPLRYLEKMESILEILFIYNVDVSFTSKMQSNAKVAWSKPKSWILEFAVQARRKAPSWSHRHEIYPLIAVLLKKVELEYFKKMERSYPKFVSEVTSAHNIWHKAEYR